MANEHRDSAKKYCDSAINTSSLEDAKGYALIAIAESLTGILELLTKLTGEKGTVLDVRVGGSVSTHSGGY